MGTLCQRCGDLGFSNALIYCVKCQLSAEHRYCLVELYDTFDEDVHWTCEDCLPQITKQSISGDPSCEQVAELGNSVALQVIKHGASYVSEQYDYLPSQPVIDPIWRGSFSICSNKFGTVNEMAAHLSIKACAKVFEAAQLLPALLPLHVHPRLDLWPNCFYNSQPTDEQIGLYFLPERKRDETLSNGLLDDLIDQDLAMKAVFDNSELLVFTSLQLTEQCQRFQGKHYLWGVFRKKQPSPHHQSDDHLIIQSTNNVQIMPSNIVSGVRPREERNLTTICGVESPHGSSGIWYSQTTEEMNSELPIVLLPPCKKIRSETHSVNLPMDKVCPGNSTSSTDASKESDEVGPSTHAEEAVEQPPSEGVAENEIRIISPDGSPESRVPDDCTHHEEDVEDRGAMSDKRHEGVAELEGVGETAVNAGKGQDDLLSGYTDTTRNSGALIMHEEVTQAVDNTSISKEAHRQGPVELSTDMSGRNSASFHQLLLFADQQVPTVPNHLGKHTVHAVPSSASQQCSEQPTATNNVPCSVLRMANTFDELDPDEVSRVDKSYVHVGEYVVRENLAPTLRAIIDKYGDIAQACPVQCVLTRSHLLETVCETIQNLQGVPFIHLRRRHLKYLDSATSFAEDMKLDVKWLRHQHDKLKETINLIKSYGSLKEAVPKNIEVAELTKRNLDIKKGDWMKVQLEYRSLENELARIAAEAEKLDRTTSNVISECKLFLKSLANGLI